MKMRARCPVLHSDRYNGFWAITRYADVRRVLTESDTFITSVQNNTVITAVTPEAMRSHVFTNIDSAVIA